MNNNNKNLPITKNEIKLELQGFAAHIRQLEADKERDLLIFEIASRMQSSEHRSLKLIDEFRFGYFMEYCLKKYGKALNEIPRKESNSADSFKQRLSELATDIENASAKNEDLQEIAGVIQMVHTLVADGLTNELHQAIAKAFAEYY